MFPCWPRGAGGVWGEGGLGISAEIAAPATRFWISGNLQLIQLLEKKYVTICTFFLMPYKKLSFDLQHDRQESQMEVA